jgi:hypothetical protein
MERERERGMRGIRRMRGTRRMRRIRVMRGMSDECRVRDK